MTRSSKRIAVCCSPASSNRSLFRMERRDRSAPQRATRSPSSRTYACWETASVRSSCSSNPLVRVADTTSSCRTTMGALPFHLCLSSPRSLISRMEKRPCSFIAICNILILREQIEILSPGHKTVSYDFLAQLVGEHILLTVPEVHMSAVLSIMPLTTSEFRTQPFTWRLTQTNSRGDGSQPCLHIHHCVPPCHDGWGAHSLCERRHYTGTRLAC